MKSQLDIYLDQYEDNNKFVNKDKDTIQTNDIVIKLKNEHILCNYLSKMINNIFSSISSYRNKLIYYILEGAIIDFLEIFDYYFQNNVLIHKIKQLQLIIMMNKKKIDIKKPYNIMKLLRRIIFIILVLYLFVTPIYELKHSTTYFNIIISKIILYIRSFTIYLLLTLLLIPYFLNILWNLSIHQLLHIKQYCHIININYINILKCIQIVNLGRNITIPLPPISKLENKLVNHSIYKTSLNDLEYMKSYNILSLIELRYNFYSSLLQLKSQLYDNYNQLKLKNLEIYQCYLQPSHEIQDNNNDILISFNKIFDYIHDIEEMNNQLYQQTNNIILLSQIESIHNNLFNNILKFLIFQYYYILTNCIYLCYQTCIQLKDDNISLVIYLYLKMFLYILQLLPYLLNDIRIMNKYRNQCLLLGKQFKQQYVINNLPNVNSNSNNDNNSNDNNTYNDINNNNTTTNNNNNDKSISKTMIKDSQKLLNKLCYENNLYNKATKSLIQLRNSYDTMSYRLWLCQDLLSQFPIISNYTTINNIDDNNNSNNDNNTFDKSNSFSNNNNEGFKTTASTTNDNIENTSDINSNNRNDNYNNTNNVTILLDNIIYKIAGLTNKYDLSINNKDIILSEIIDNISNTITTLPNISEYKDFINNILLLRESYLNIKLFNINNNLSNIDINNVIDRIYDEKDSSSNENDNEQQTNLSNYKYNSIYEELDGIGENTINILNNNSNNNNLLDSNTNILDVYTTIITHKQINELNLSINNNNYNHNENIIKSKLLLSELQEQFKIFHNNNNCEINSNLNMNKINSLLPNHAIERTHCIIDNNSLPITSVHSKYNNINTTITDDNDCYANTTTNNDNNNYNNNDNNNMLSNVSNMIQIGSILIPKHQYNEQNLSMVSLDYNKNNNINSNNNAYNSIRSEYNKMIQSNILFAIANKQNNEIISADSNKES